MTFRTIAFDVTDPPTTLSFEARADVETLRADGPPEVLVAVRPEHATGPRSLRWQQPTPWPTAQAVAVAAPAMPFEPRFLRSLRQLPTPAPPWRLQSPLLLKSRCHQLLLPMPRRSKLLSHWRPRQFRALVELSPGCHRFHR